MSSHPRILLVDDDPAGAELTLAALAMIIPAAVIDAVADGEAALDYVFHRGDYAARAPAPPDAVLLDLKMPRVDGHEVLREIRADARHRDLRVLVLTSSAQADDRRRAEEAGANAYLVKPDSLEALLHLLREQLRPHFA